MQRAESIEDQHRVCERLAERHDFTVISRFSDAAISGGTAARPGYQDMLRAARRHDFDVIIAEDTSRLWRNLAEQSPRLAELSDLGIQVVTHDLDTRHESAEIMGAVGGAMASSYRKEIRPPNTPRSRRQSAGGFIGRRQVLRVCQRDRFRHDAAGHRSRPGRHHPPDIRNVRQRLEPQVDRGHVEP
jgi:DNA invertase Pin-like site-specific DNA recombinase